MRFVVSILAHERPEIVHDQIQNIFRYLPDSAVVLHLHVKFDWGEKTEDFSQHSNVFVNPQSLPTFWGNLHHAHNSNFRFASTLAKFDYFLLHSSSDLFVKFGVDRYIEGHEVGVSLVPPQPTWGAPLFAEGDPVFQKIKKESGAKELWCSQVEGTFYKREIFGEMVSIIEKNFDYRKTLPYVHEEIYYPTMASGLGIPLGFPYLLREDKTNLPQLDAVLVEQIRSGELVDHFITRWKLGREVTSKVWEGKSIFAMRPIPRVIDHPVRRYIRELAEES